MKKLFIPVAIAATLGLQSCKDDFDVAAPYKQITMAYGILNAEDTAHYIRIEKAFLDNSKSAIDMSQVADSSYFKNLTVVMKEYEGDVVRRIIPMYRVDMRTEGYPKDAAGSQGFFTDPHYAYKLKTTSNPDSVLNPYRKYRLIINNADAGRIDSSEIFYVVNTNKEKNPNNFHIPAFSNAGLTLNFAKTTLKASYTLTGTTPRNGRLVEGILRFHVVEKDNSTGQKKRISADFRFGQDVKNGTEQFRMEVMNSAFYGFLYDALGPAPSNVVRYLDSCDFFIYCGGNELYNYKQLQSIQSGSLIGDQIKPIFSNMKGDDTYGIITSRALNTRNNVAIDLVTIDSIRLNPITKSLNIVGPSDE
ncbi:MAG TPA: hypothetical protein VK167_15515 [Flavipsychrobacter sp.]|nr:hypothetical protein [Flavipsychrobacter sp.]